MCLTHLIKTFFLLLCIISYSIYAEEENAACQHILEIETSGITDSAFLAPLFNSKSDAVVRNALLAVGRTKDNSLLKVISNWTDRSSEFKKTAALAIGLVGTETAIEELTKHLESEKDLETQGAVLFSLGLAGGSSTVKTVTDFLSKHSEPVLTYRAAEALTVLFEKAPKNLQVSSETLSRLAFLTQEKGAVGIAAASALLSYKGPAASIPSKEILLAVKNSKSPEAQALLLNVLGRKLSPESTGILVQTFHATPSIGVKIEALRALKGQPVSPEMVAVYQKALSSDSNSIVATALQGVPSLGKERKALDAQVKALAKKSTSAWIKTAALNTVHGINSELARSPVKKSRKIMSTKALTTPKWEEVVKVLQSEVTLKTTRGDIHLKFFEAAPISSYRFVEKLKSHFYDGRAFYQVFPGIAAEAGDPETDSDLKPEYKIRDEISLRSHWRGTVSVSKVHTQGVTSQFFISLAPNFTLDGKYTPFAEIVSGMEVVDKIELGDKILGFSIKEPA